MYQYVGSQLASYLFLPSEMHHVPVRLLQYIMNKVNSNRSYSYIATTLAYIMQLAS